MTRTAVAGLVMIELTVASFDTVESFVVGIMTSFFVVVDIIFVWDGLNFARVAKEW